MLEASAPTCSTTSCRSARRDFAFGDDGDLTDAGMRDALEGLVAVLAARAGAARGGRDVE